MARSGNKIDSRSDAAKRLLLADCEAVAAHWAAQLDEEQKNSLAQVLLILAARLSHHTLEARLRIFRDAERFGAHFLPVHFYSPIPSRAEIDERVYSRRYDWIPGLRLDRGKHVAWLDRVARHSEGLKDIPADAAGMEQFHWNNAAFCPGDAVVYYGMIRELRPDRIIEIGSGHSTLLALKALVDNGGGRLTCIEPYPMPHLRQLARDGHITLLETKVQTAALELFEELRPNDILFIDSSHVSKIGSDVNHEVFEILPRLRAGVFVHIHDIFLPWDFSRNWIEDLQLFWNEQYLIMAFLAYNSRFSIELSNQWVARELASEYATRFGSIGGAEIAGGGSLWLSVGSSNEGGGG